MLYLQQAHIPRSLTHIDRPHGSAIAFIALLHIAGIYALANSMGFISVKPPPERIVISFHKDPAKPEQPLPPPIPLLQPYAPPVPVPVDSTIQIVLPPESGNAISVPAQIAALPPIPLPVVPPPVQFVPARAVVSTHTAPEYPLLSRRLGEKGSVRLSLTIAEDGMVMEAVVLKSSGFARLDAAAIEWVKHRWRYTPAMRGTMPVRAAAETVLTFRLE